MGEKPSQSGQEMEMSQTPQESYVSGDSSGRATEQPPSSQDTKPAEIPTFEEILEEIKDQKATEAEALHQQEIAEKARLEQLSQERLTACTSALQDHPRIQILSSIFDNRRIMEAFEYINVHWISKAKEKREEIQEERKKNNFVLRWVQNKLFPLPSDEDIEASIKQTEQRWLNKDDFARSWVNSVQDDTAVVETYLGYHYDSRYSDTPDKTPTITKHFSQKLNTASRRPGDPNLYEILLRLDREEVSHFHSVNISIVFNSRALHMAKEVILSVDPSPTGASHPYKLKILQAKNLFGLHYPSKEFRNEENISCESIETAIRAMANYLTQREKKTDE